MRRAGRARDVPLRAAAQLARRPRVRGPRDRVPGHRRHQRPAAAAAVLQQPLRSSDAERVVDVFRDALVERIRRRPGAPGAPGACRRRQRGRVGPAARSEQPETPAKPAKGPLDPTGFTYSVVIPVFNSEPIVGTTIERTVAFFEAHGLSYEIVLVNDASTDGSWEVLARRGVRATPRPRRQPAPQLRPAQRESLRDAPFERRLHRHDGRRPPEPAGGDHPSHRRGDERRRCRVREVPPQAGRHASQPREQGHRPREPARSSASPPTSSSATSGSCAATWSTGSATRAARTRTSPARRCCTRTGPPTSTSSTRPAPVGQEHLQPDPDREARAAHPLQLLAVPAAALGPDRLRRSRR